MVENERMIIARGRTADVLALGNDQVLKLFYDWVPAIWIEHETAAARLVSRTDLPTPRLLGEQVLDGRHGLIYERVTGPSLLSLLVSHPWNCIKYARLLAGLHVVIHKQRGEGLPSLKVNLAWTIQHLEGLPNDLLKTALDRLSQLPDGDTLCHFDFHPDQVLVTADGPVIIDWMAVLNGQPAADIARSEVVIRFGPLLHASWLEKHLVGVIRRIFFRAYLTRYRKLNPSVTLAEIQEWLPLVALARLAEKIPGEENQLQSIIQTAFKGI